MTVGLFSFDDYAPETRRRAQRVLRLEPIA